MKQTQVQKTADTPVTPEQLEQINRFSRRELTVEEVYVFSLILCDNEVDRDYERFPTASLQVLAELFLGKTGIFDHNPTGENQTARIFATALEEDPNRVTAAGEPYAALRAWAYMVRCSKNEDLILEIDAGIKKEVSVGCAVKRRECSVCGADIQKAPCSHQKGETYNGVLCWWELLEPTDAYEWSFVAVPAQKQAGITKGRLSGGFGELYKALESGNPVRMTGEEAAALAGRLRELDQLAAFGRSCQEERRRDLVRLASFALPKLPGEVAGEIARQLPPPQLEALCKALEPLAPGHRQLEDPHARTQTDQRAFLV